MDKIKIIDQDIVFLSYDEPNAEKNYADLCSKLPWAKRVHGVDGSDAAHKACADVSETEYFVTIDGDNIIDTEFLQQEINIEQLGLTPDHVFSWCGNVHVNGLQYGNGGLKLWTRKFVNNMKTHENSNADDTKGLVEFCFDERYYQFNDSYSISYTNASPFQAWRAGFREGVKMSLNEGAKHVDVKNIWWQNLDRLRIWCSIGADVENGNWSMLGARMGCYMTMCTDWDYTNVRDFKYLTDYWKDEKVADLDVASELFRYGNNIRSELNLEIADVDALGSKFFKSVYHNTPRIIKKR
jgi:hypothetical protein